MAKVIIIGGGLSGLSAAHTILQSGGSILLIDKNAFLGGNSTKATSGINGTITRTQIGKGIADNPQIFYEDTAKAARDLIRPALVKVLTYQSGAAVDWLQEEFKLDLSLVSRLGGHSFQRTHRGTEKFPGMTITYGLMEALEAICKKEPKRARLITKARVVNLIRKDGEVVGVEYEKAGKKSSEYGPVIIASGGYGADFSSDSLIKKYRPDLIEKDLATTNGAHCTGDGVKMAMAIGANGVDMKQVQVHPTGLIDPKQPDAKVKFLAAEALRGCGGLLLDANGKRFCDELGHRDYVTGEMWKNKGPFRLVLNSGASKEIEWHVKHYTGRGLMKKFNSGAALAKEMGIAPEVLAKTFEDYNGCAKAKKDPFGKKFYANVPLKMDEYFNVAFVTPVVHYTMGGIEVDEHSRVIGASGPIPGLWAAGEVMGGVHGANRLGGSSLLDCVVFGRVAGADASSFLLRKMSSGSAGVGGAASAASGVAINLRPGPGGVSIDVKWDGSAPAASSASAASDSSASGSDGSAAPPPEGVDNWDDPEEDAKKGKGAAAGGAAKGGALKEYSADEVAKHNKKDDCWVIVNGQVLDVTKFLPDHPGGPNAILLFAGKDASAEFNMLHKADVVEKYAPDSIIGTLKGADPKQIRAKL